MNSTEYKILLEKYMQGATSLNEEKLLKTYSLEHNTAEKEWFAVCEQQNNSVDITANVWENIQNKTKTKHRRLYATWWAAAVVLFTVGVTAWQVKKYKELQNQKLAVLEEALLVLSENVNPKPKPEIIYQDEFIVLYKE